MEIASTSHIIVDEPINLQDLVEALPGYIYWKNARSEYMGCNRNLAEASGLKKCSDIIGKKDEDFGWGEEQAASFRRDDQEVIRTGQTRTTEHMMPLEVNGKIEMTCIRTEKIPLYNKQGKAVGVLGVALDITDRKRAEEALKEAKERAEVASRAKSQFISVVSHELRLPLSAILGMTDFLMEDNLTLQERQEYLQAISKAGAHLLSLINDILDFAKLEADKLELAPAPLDLKKLIEEITTMMTAQTKAKGLDLWLSYEPNIPHLIVGDSRALRQILVNLLGNAIKFTTTGHVAINVQCVSQTATHAKLKLAVEDSGVGIPADKLELVFERFQQVDASYNRAYTGTGLGLAITKKLVELMSGTVGVTSEVGKGSTFFCVINFPLQQEDTIQSPWQIYQNKVRILIVTDSLKGEIIRKNLGVSHCQIVAGKEARNALITAQKLKEPYDILIVDDKLRHEKSFEILEVFQKHSRLYQPLCLLLTPALPLVEREAAKKAGFFDFIIEPVQPSELQTTLTTAWERWQEKATRQSKLQALTQPRVLLVEDDEMIQFIHKKILTQLGCNVDVAESGKKALTMLAELYDLVFMDMGLPDVAGPDVLKTFRQMEDSAHRTPVIAVTGYGGEEDVQNFIAAGANEVLVKPVKREIFQEKLKAYTR